MSAWSEHYSRTRPILEPSAKATYRGISLGMSMIRKSDPATIRPYLEDASGMSGGHADGVLLPSDVPRAENVSS